MGVSGRACVQRAICEAAAEGVPEHLGLVGELAALLLASVNRAYNRTYTILHTVMQERCGCVKQYNTQRIACFHSLVARQYRSVRLSKPLKYERGIVHPTTQWFHCLNQNCFLLLRSKTIRTNKGHK